jgi:hypothetical protein
MIKTYIKFLNGRYLSEQSTNDKIVYVSFARAQQFNNSADAQRQAFMLGIDEDYEIIKMRLTFDLIESRIIKNKKDSSNSMKIITRYKVYEIDHERGWGTDTTLHYYETEEAARNFVTSINSKNTEKCVPDFYTTAEYAGKVEGVIVDGKFRELKQ